MKLIRMRNPMGLEIIREFLQPSFDSVSLEQFFTMARDLMEQRSDDLFIVIVLDEADACIAGTVAIAPPGCSHVFVLQAWSKPGHELVSDKMFLRLCLWAKDKDRSSIRAETKRDARPYLRRWNFDELAVVLEFKLDEEFETRLLQGQHSVLVGDGLAAKHSAELAPKENDDGRQQRRRDEDNVDLERKSDEGVEATGRVDQAEPGSTRGAVLGGDNGGVGNGDAVDSGSAEPDGRVRSGESV
jgi:hypothetical protein